MNKGKKKQTDLFNNFSNDFAIEKEKTDKSKKAATFSKEKKPPIAMSHHHHQQQHHHRQSMVMEGMREEKWIKHYSSRHTILLVGEGDFSFSWCLALAFGSAANIFATSLDSYDELVVKYKNVKVNLGVLEYLGASLLHGVDATTMNAHPALQWRKFHRVIYNFPHAGFFGGESNPNLITMHRNLVRGFLWNAKTMLWPDGEIHINHKITAPFDTWRIEELAFECSLVLVGLDNFKIKDYPGYENKRGSGSRSDEPFPLGECRTFIFKPMVVQVGPASTSYGMMMTAPQLPHVENNADECMRIFGDYLNHVEATFGSADCDVRHSVCEALRVGYERYMGGGFGRESSGYIGVLYELHHLSILRSQRLRNMRLVLDQQQW
ncbi:hypothetical protein ABFS83_13G153100 [Erythranthe nasuta]